MRGAGGVALMVAALAASLGIAAACTPDDNEEYAAPETAYGAVDATGDAVAPLAVTLTDENVIALLDTTYDALIELDGLAASKARDTRVRETVSEAMTRHRQMRADNLTLARDINASPKLVGNEPIEGHHQAMEQLRMQNGARFDRAYLDHLSHMHQALLSEVYEALEMPVTLKVREHLERIAETLETDLTRTRALAGVLREEGVGARG